MMMPSPPHFFTLEDMQKLGSSLKGKVSVVQGKVWASDERNPTWTVESPSFDDFKASLKKLPSPELLAFDESFLDEDSLQTLQDDLYHYAEEHGVSQDLVVKAMSALRSHENELVAVMGYAFLKTGPVIFVRAQGELARFVYNPERLLSSEGLSHVRKLKTLSERL